MLLNFTNIISLVNAGLFLTSSYDAKKNLDCPSNNAACGLLDELYQAGVNVIIPTAIGSIIPLLVAFATPWLFFRKGHEESLVIRRINTAFSPPTVTARMQPALKKFILSSVPFFTLLPTLTLNIASMDNLSASNRDIAPQVAKFLKDSCEPSVIHAGCFSAESVLDKTCQAMARFNCEEKVGPHWAFASICLSLLPMLIFAAPLFYFFCCRQEVVAQVIDHNPLEPLIAQLPGEDEDEGEGEGNANYLTITSSAA